MSAQPLEARVAHIEGAFVQVNERLSSIDRRLDTMENILNSRFSLIDQRFNWLIGIVVGTWITTILAALLHH